LPHAPVQSNEALGATHRYTSIGMLKRLRSSLSKRLDRFWLSQALSKNPGRSFVSDASFWRPERTTDSGWIGHAPFAFWLIATHRPRTVVELGTHTGYSFLCFCQAIKKLGYGARSYAIDTWKGDEHAGLYGDNVLEGLRSYHDPRYGKFSTLIESTFDDALPRFADGSIDLLHVDGRHFYEDVRHDFHTWRRKLSDRAVVLFHDTNVHDRAFGVFRLWSEVARDAPHFEFTHCHGLGVLAQGANVAPPLFDLLNLQSEDEVAKAVRSVYGRLADTL
jgi:Methyltransferase domain